MSYYQTIYNRLRKGGFTEAAALAMEGNWLQESGCEPNRIENDYDSFRHASKLYTEQVESGVISRQTFGSDQRGYGLAQWTYVNNAKTEGRKFNLYDFWKKSGRALDDVIMQVEFCLWELTYTNYSSIMYELRTGTDLYHLTDLICRRYEQPAVNNVDVRYRYAQMIQGQIDLNNWQNPDEEDEEVPAENPKELYWPPKRQICQGMSGGDVSVLKAILNALDLYSYDQGEDVDIFGQSLRDAVIAYQKQAFPNQPSEWDGIVGNKTWGKLLERG